MHLIQTIIFIGIFGCVIGEKCQWQNTRKQTRENIIRAALCNAQTCRKCVKIIDILNLPQNPTPMQRKCVLLLALSRCCSNKTTYLRRF